MNDGHHPGAGRRRWGPTYTFTNRVGNADQMTSAVRDPAARPTAPTFSDTSIATRDPDADPLVDVSVRSDKGPALRCRAFFFPVHPLRALEGQTGLRPSSQSRARVVGSQAAPEEIELASELVIGGKGQLLDERAKLTDDRGDRPLQLCQAEPMQGERLPQLRRGSVGPQQTHPLPAEGLAPPGVDVAQSRRPAGRRRARRLADRRGSGPAPGPARRSWRRPRNAPC